MPPCLICGNDETLPYNCKYCGGQFCSEHQLPESHDCDGVGLHIPSGKHFESDFDDSVDKKGRSRRRSKPTDHRTAGKRSEPKYPGWPPKNSKRAHSPKRPTTIDPKTVGTRPEASYSSPPPVTLKSKQKRSHRSGGDDESWASLKRLLLVILIVVGGAVSANGYLSMDGGGGLEEAISAALAGSSPNESESAISPTPMSGPTYAPIANINARQVEVLIHTKMNIRRQKHGLSPLEHDAELRQIAREHSAVMAANRDIFHTQPDGDELSDRYDQAGYACRVSVSSTSYVTGGENVAQTWYKEDVIADGGVVHYDKPNELAEGVVNQLMDSTGHRENILKPYWENQGIGVNVTEVDGKIAVYVTQNFC